VKALYDYEANAAGELSVKEGDVLLVFDKEDAWLLVQSQAEGGKAGFVPENYVEVRYATYNCTNRNTEQLLRRPLPMTEWRNRMRQAV
jgi:Variant SH3 domain